MLLTRLNLMSTPLLATVLGAGLGLVACRAAAGAPAISGDNQAAEAQPAPAKENDVKAEKEAEVFEKNEPDEDLRLLVEKVLKAYGGEGRLERLTAITQKMKQTDKQAGEKGNVSTVEHYVQLPDKLRIGTESNGNGNKTVSVFVLIGGEHWNTVNGEPVRSLAPDPPAAYREDFLKFYGPRAVLRLKAPAYRLSLLGEIKVGDRPAAGVRITLAAPDFKLDRKLFFDKTTGLLLSEDDGSSNLETLYSDYKTIDGVPVPQKITRKVNGQVVTETQVIEFRAADKLDPALFRRTAVAGGNAGRS